MTVKQLEIILDEARSNLGSGNKADLIQGIKHEAEEVHHRRPVNKKYEKECKSTAIQSKTSSACNSEQDLDAKFCNQCGSQFPKA